MTLWKCACWATRHFYDALGICLLFWSCHQLHYISGQCLPPRRWRRPLQLPTSLAATLSLTSLYAWGLKRCSSPLWSSSIRSLPAQSLGTSLRSGTQRERGNLVLAQGWNSNHTSSETFMLPILLLCVFTDKEKHGKGLRMTRRTVWRHDINFYKAVKLSRLKFNLIDQNLICICRIFQPSNMPESTCLYMNFSSYTPHTASDKWTFNCEDAAPEWQMRPVVNSALHCSVSFMWVHVRPCILKTPITSLWGILSVPAPLEPNRSPEGLRKNKIWQVKKGLHFSLARGRITLYCMCVKGWVEKYGRLVGMCQKTRDNCHEQLRSSESECAISAPFSPE